MHFSYEDEREVLALLTFIESGCGVTCITREDTPVAASASSPTILIDDATSHLYAVANELDAQVTRASDNTLRRLCDGFVRSVVRLGSGVAEPNHHWILFEHRDMLPACYQNCDASQRLDETGLRERIVVPGSPDAVQRWKMRLSLSGSGNILSPDSPSSSASSSSPPQSLLGNLPTLDADAAAVYDCLWRVPIHSEMAPGAMHMIFNNAPVYGSVVDRCARLLIPALSAVRDTTPGTHDTPSWPSILDGSYLTLYRRGPAAPAAAPACFMSGVRAYTYARDFEVLDEESFADTESFDDAMRRGSSCLDISDDDIAHRHIVEESRCGKWVSPCVLGDVLMDTERGWPSVHARLGVARDFISDPEKILPGSMFGLQLYHVLRQYTPPPPLPREKAPRIYIRSSRIYETMLTVIRYEDAIMLDEDQRARAEIIQIVPPSSPNSASSSVQYIHWTRLMSWIRHRPIRLYRSIDAEAPTCVLSRNVKLQCSALCYAAASLSTAYVNAKIRDSRDASDVQWTAVAAYAILFQSMCMEVSAGTMHAVRIDELAWPNAPYVGIANGERPGNIVRTMFRGESHYTLHPILEYSMYNGLRGALQSIVGTCVTRFRAFGLSHARDRAGVDAAMSRDPIAGLLSAISRAQHMDRATLEFLQTSRAAEAATLAARMVWIVRLLVCPETLAARFVPYTSPFSLERSCLHRAHGWRFRLLPRETKTTAGGEKSAPGLTEEGLDRSRVLRDRAIYIACPYYNDLCAVSQLHFTRLQKETDAIQRKLQCAPDQSVLAWTRGDVKGQLDAIYFNPRYLTAASQQYVHIRDALLYVHDDDRNGAQARGAVGYTIVSSRRCLKRWVIREVDALDVT